MPYVLKPNMLYVKDPNGDGYLPQNIISDQTTDEMIADIEAAGAVVIGQVGQAIVDSQEAIDGIESQKDTMIASIASIAGQGTDTTLTQTGVAADAKAAGDEISDLKSAFDTGLSATNLTGWQDSVIDSATGNTWSQNYRIRNLTFVGLSTGISRITSDSGYLFLVYAWDQSGNYVGSLKTGRVFNKQTSDFLYVSEFDCGEFPAYKFKITAKTNPEGDITPADGVHFYYHTFTDKTLTKANKAADAKITGDAILYCNAYNCIPVVNDNTTINGVTYDISGDGISVSGQTSTYGAPYQLYVDGGKLPDNLEVGKTYYIVHESTNVNLVIYAYNGTTTTEIMRTKTSMMWTVPATLTPGCSIRLLVSASTAQFSETIAYPMILNAKTNSQLTGITEQLTETTNALQPAKGSLASGTDIDNVTTPGIHLIVGAEGYSYTHSPLPAYAAGLLEVFTSGRIPAQRVTRYSNGDQFVRLGSSSTGFVGRDWYKITNTYNNTFNTQSYENSYSITCEPEITTDTNNYLASTGDTTDRTSDIQTMLNTTGVCHLGPGVFYVTGVEIPAYGCLTGCGEKTNLILAASVETGYAIKLLDSGTVKDLRLSGQLSGSPSSETVGTRHGILYQGTATSSSDPASARRYYGVISNVFIGSFSGGGITCVNTGGQVNSNLEVTNCHIRACTVGINISHYSEFHRFTNISATNCYYGCVCNGGNCNFVNCSFSYCRIGILMDDSTGQSPNNSHGTFSACTVCHSGTDNDGIAIKLLGLDSGEIFVGMQIFYGSVVIDSCKGIRVIGGNFGNSTPLTVTNSTIVIFSDCQMTSASASSLTQSGNTTLKFVECYNRDGTVYNPMAS